MYQYFLGEKSNITTRTSDKPIVIAADKLSSKKIDDWLNLFCIDLDELICSIKTVVDAEICRIESKTKVMELGLTNEKIAELEFVYIDNEHPRFCVRYESTEFLCSPNNVMVIEKKSDRIADIEFEVTYGPVSQNISISKKDELTISIEFNSADFDIFKNMKNSFGSISDISEMYNLLEWSYQFLPEDTNHIFLCINRKTKEAIDFVEVLDNRVENYQVMMGPLKVVLDKNMSGNMTVTGGDMSKERIEMVKQKGKKVVGMMAVKMKKLNDFLKK